MLDSYKRTCTASSANLCSLHLLCFLRSDTLSCYNQLLNRYWSDHHAYTQYKTYNHLCKINTKTHATIPSSTSLGLLDSGIDSVSSSSASTCTFLKLELEPEGRKYNRKSAIPEPMCTPTYLLFIILLLLLLLLLLITKWRIEASFDGQTTTGANTDKCTCTSVRIFYYSIYVYVHVHRICVHVHVVITLYCMLYNYMYKVCTLYLKFT